MQQRQLPILMVLCLFACATPTVRPDPDPQLLRRAGIDPAQIRCNSENRFGQDLRRDAQAGAAEMMQAIAPALVPQSESEKAALQHRLQGLLMWRMVRAVLIEGNNNNLGAFALRGRTYVDGQGHERPVLVFRSGITPAPGAEGSCFSSLLTAAGVRHVVNLFDGDIPVSDLVAAESGAATGHGATYTTASDDPADYGPWRELLRSHYDDPAQRQRAFAGMARLIREQILLPGGAPPRGNIHIHCGGGMHRSGMIAGVIERCVNQEPMDVVLGHYRTHVGYLDQAHRGGLEEGNLRVLQDFPCDLLAGP